VAKRIGLGLVVFCALLALRGSSGGDEERVAKDLRLVASTAKRGLRALGLTEKDVRTRHDFLRADEWRLPLLDEYLARPLEVPRDAWKRFAPWILEREGLRASLVRAGEPLGLSAPEAPVLGGDAKDLVAALLDLWEALPGGSPPAKGALAKDLQVLPSEALPFLARLVTALAHAVRERAAAVEKLSETEWVRLRQYGSQLNTGMPVAEQAPMLRNLHARIDLPRIYRASLEVAAVLEELPGIAETLRRRSKKPEFRVRFETPAGLVEFGGWGPDTYENDVLLSVDFGGNDLYTRCAGGSLYVPAKASVAVDLDGDDVYRTPVGLGQGSGMYGVGFLVDCAGDDLYETKNVSQGSGHVGVGVLWDLAGDDHYAARSISQGTGFQGVGLLRDEAGRDVYQIGYGGQGYGATQGFGILDDRGGDDTYLAGGLHPDRARDESRFLTLAQGFGQGVRADREDLCMSGGIGLLAEHGGDDHYVADVFGQGCAYWYAIGVLLDGGGRDFYQVHNYGQGSGIHMAVGVHMDLNGDDRYLGRGHALGYGLDRGFGFFGDFLGNDVYDSTDRESQGGAVKPYAVALFADLRGDDTYRGGGNGYAREPEEGAGGPWPKGFFMDLGGDDDYTAGSHDAAEGRQWVTNRYGWGTDK
jgi:hypothetical protein